MITYSNIHYGLAIERKYPYDYLL